MDQRPTDIKIAKVSISTKIGVVLAAVAVVTLGIVFGYAMYIGGFSK